MIREFIPLPLLVDAATATHDAGFSKPTKARQSLPFEGYATCPLGKIARSSVSRSFPVQIPREVLLCRGVRIDKQTAKFHFDTICKPSSTPLPASIHRMQHQAEATPRTIHQAL